MEIEAEELTPAGLYTATANLLIKEGPFEGRVAPSWDELPLHSQQFFKRQLDYLLDKRYDTLQKLGYDPSSVIKETHLTVRQNVWGLWFTLRNVCYPVSNPVHHFLTIDSVIDITYIPGVMQFCPLKPKPSKPPKKS